MEPFILPAPFLPEYHAVLTSTGDRARELAKAGAPEGTVVFAEAQTAGRGQQGHTFFSPPDTGLYMSLLLRPKQATDAQVLTMAAAVAVAQACEAVTGRPVAVKWVNDILLDSRKVCGILAEAGFFGDQPAYAVIGIGVNVREPAGGFPPELADSAGALFPAAAPDRRGELAAEILTRLWQLYTALPDTSFTTTYTRFLDRFLERKLGKER